MSSERSPPDCPPSGSRRGDQHQSRWSGSPSSTASKSSSASSGERWGSTPHRRERPAGPVCVGALRSAGCEDGCERRYPDASECGYQASRVCEWKSMMARRSPRRPMTRSVSVAGSVIARCAVSCHLGTRAQHQVDAPPELQVRAVVRRHPHLRFPGGRIELVRRRQHGDVVHAHRRRESTLGAGHATQDGRGLDEPVLCRWFPIHGDRWMGGEVPSNVPPVCRPPPYRDSAESLRSPNRAVRTLSHTTSPQQDRDPTRAPRRPIRTHSKTPTQIGHTRLGGSLPHSATSSDNEAEPARSLVVALE